MRIVPTQTHHLIADGDAMWFAGAATFAVVQVTSRANKVRTTIRPAATGGPAGGIS
jgi:hypothetical protein